MVGYAKKEKCAKPANKKVLPSQIDFRAAKKPANEPIFRIYLPYLQQRIHGPRTPLVPLLNLRLSKQALIPSQSSGIKGILEISGGVKPLIPKPQAVFFFWFYLSQTMKFSRRKLMSRINLVQPKIADFGLIWFIEIISVGWVIGVSPSLARPANRTSDVVLSWRAEATGKVWTWPVDGETTR